MLYEERIVDGVLCWRMSPRDCKGYGDWIPKTAQELTALILELRQPPGGRQLEEEQFIVAARKFWQDDKKA